MRIDTLSLLDFRNYANLELDLTPGLNVLYGANAQGKSAILEAVYILATSKSHRTSKDSELIRIGSQACRISAKVCRPESNDVTLDVIISRTEKKQVRINTVRHQRISELIGNLNAVVFSALDIEMIRGEPGLRRRFLNLDISQVSPQYVFALGRYKRALEQRNNLLKEARLGNASTEGLDVWDRQLAEYGAAITCRRETFCRALAEAAAETYGLITDSAEKLEISYRSSVGASEGCSDEETADRLFGLLASRRDMDLARGTTSTGPHRDDIEFKVAGLDARYYASQGQQRTAALAVKLAEVTILESAVGEGPVVLLDDAGAELDELRRSRMLKAVAGRCQTLITTTRPEELGAEMSASAELYRVVSGTVRRE